MSPKRKLVRKIQKISQKLCNNSSPIMKEQSLWLLRCFLITRRQSDWINAGFVLPTVVMVSLVVVLLTTAILFRSFERSKNASNVRVNEAVLNAASPALERAKAKIDQLFKDPRLPRSTPSDFSLTQVIGENISEFTFGDETPLKVVKDFNSTSGIQDEETLNTAWKYPVDTDNNGKLDSYTLYGIYFRTPTSNRPRNPLEARTQPMDEGATGGKCQSDVATSADLVGSQGWYKVGSKLKRSLFIYTATVPITDTTGLGSNYEKFSGNKGFVALEYQQDRERIPLNNNAVLYENDLEIAPGFGININGRIFTNGNLLTRQSGTAASNTIRYYLVSSPKSCYYTEENSKIIVAGNVINSRVDESSSGDGVFVDLFNQGYDVDNIAIVQDKLDNTKKTVPASVYGNTAAFNDEAYAKRIDHLVAVTNATYPSKTALPEEVQQQIDRQIAADPTLDPAAVRDEQLRIYFRKRTRRVPYAEIPFNSNPLKYTLGSTSYDYETNSPLQGSGNSLRPVDAWVFPYDPSDGKTASNYANIAIKDNGTKKLHLSATDPAVQVNLGKEERIGDRVLVGNNLPQFIYSTTKGKFVSSEEGQVISGKEWDNNTNQRKRFTQAYQLDDLGITDRDDFWEKSAAQKPQGPLDVVGGLRVITGAGIYLPNDYNSSNHTFTNTQKIIWPDYMPMGVTTKPEGLPDDKTPYLRMRATAVYHYQDDSYDPKTPTDYQTPIACVSSYYDPTNSTTARNQTGLPDVSLRDNYRDLTGLPNVDKNPGKSHNGVVYSASSLSTTGYEAELNYQAQLKYPNGRLVNEQLKKALDKIAASKSLTLAEQSAVDSAMCALKILDGTIGSPTDSAIPHGAIMETAFLDARQIKAIDKSASGTSYDLDVELRQPLEIRATIIDLDLLRRKSKTGGEFLFPNSGIIYATRDDALPDASNASKDVSATDFRLDPTRRPNGIMLINGSNLSRNSTYKPEEKGLTLASNLPVYIKGNFNIHRQEEFTDILLKSTNSWGNDFYKRKTLNPQFACRPGQFSGCTTGETWRSASVIADAITILSDNFRLGFRQEGDYDLRTNYDVIDKDRNPVFVTFDADGDKFLGNVDETKFGFDLNGDGDAADTTVSETQITASAAAKINGFWDNNFVTSFPWKDNNSSYGNPTDLDNNPIQSSYFNNFVTPIQRRVPFPEYVMELCRKPTITACGPSDWSVGYATGSTVDWDYKATDSGTKRILPNDSNFTVDKLGAGTTARPALNAADRHFPRRVAFLRDSKGNLILSGGRPIPLGIKGTDNPSDGKTDNAGQVNYYPYTNTTIAGTTYYPAYSSSNRPRLNQRALWFKTDKSNTANYGHSYPLWIENRSSLSGTRVTEQPLLIPVLQIQYPLTSPSSNTSTLNDSGDARTTGNWMQTATPTETNLVFAQGDTPGRPVESNGGLENFVRYLERWQNGPNNTDLVNHIAAGAFIQFKRSSFATAPFQVFTETYNNSSTGYSPTGTIFGYPQAYRLSVNQTNNDRFGRTPFYTGSQRLWGYDVALLTQLPDLFSQRFTSPATNPPNEFYREVGRDDAWVKTLLCAAQNSSTGGYENAPSTIYGSNYKYALSQDQRGTCP
ncbi:hormogonium polysaccharide biosynthesis protein HpsA [Fischerella thermalis]|uniref:hormogonium polysaccharide biosynthesis protein HpsA n=2 Tax=Fischerella thermalis TaxID=372787 RepID=UPI000C7FA5FE|nr:hormogonium polysaccharide biosynthesis protein HpsA [Fischerella thermalis]PLZ19776.1 hypothetical protein CBP19_01065 [Fischerella thermalis WC1110]PLZ41084.1 hypothetical protein CBP25_18155 [Fischerella thermalis WC527]PLZ42661.1 hypothetical protein CBP26_06855 [Fischerella thermalis WC538]PLZ68121.1 hypothetical protein CBP23_02235 [Fischerella thermalis WC344]